jgi:hypothetical protein
MESGLPSKEQIEQSCFNLMRRLSPNDISKNIAGLANLISDENLKYEIIQKIDQPLGKVSWHPRLVNKHSKSLSTNHIRSLSCRA